jgi:hypothetical protein
MQIYKNGLRIPNTHNTDHQPFIMAGKSHQFLIAQIPTTEFVQKNSFLLNKSYVLVELC